MAKSGNEFIGNGSALWHDIVETSQPHRYYRRTFNGRCDHSANSPLEPRKYKIPRRICSVCAGGIDLAFGEKVNPFAFVQFFDGMVNGCLIDTFSAKCFYDLSVSEKG